ncbi:FIMAH domain-containing protein [Paenibacillus senegalensis]|uniref:FIMAH domain-containing protein n=1 Tax=Paenibacillus senegalensis TaxID=1465766 RepID=UPI0002898134|nr:carbohydrate binding domain-containing protein [Paenibacillus senegalensis]
MKTASLRLPKLLLLVLCLGILSPYLVPQTSSAAVNYEEVPLLNAGFEDPLDQGEIPGWNFTSPLSRNAFTISDSVYKEGFTSLKLLDLSASSYGLESDYIPVSPNDIYTVSVETYLEPFTEEDLQVMAANGVSAPLQEVNRPGLYVRFYDENHVRIDQRSTDFTSPLEEWGTMSIEHYQAPANARYATILFWGFTSNVAKAYFDEVQLWVAVPETSDNMLHNGGFELPLTSDGAIPGWTVIGNPAYLEITDEIPAFEGQYSLKVNDPSSEHPAALESSFIPITPGEIYEANAMVLAPEGRIGLYLRYYDQNGVRIGNYSVFTTDEHKDDWAPLSLSYEAPADAVHATVLVYSTIAGTAFGYVDDIHLVQFQPSNFGVFTNLGTQITRAVSPSASFARDSSGTLYMHVAVNGEPAKLAVINMETGEVERMLDLPGASTAWAMETGHDGKVYIGGSRNGQLYRYTPGDSYVESVGRPQGVTHIWDIKKGPDGKLFIGAYPEGNVIEFDTSTDSFTDHGPMVQGELYARSLDYDAEENVLYVGVGTTTHLIRYDLNTGTKTDILPASYEDSSYPMSVNVVGDYLAVYLEKSTVLFIMNKHTGEVVYEESQARQRVAASPEEDKIYYLADNHLKVFDLATHASDALVNLQTNAYPRDITLIDLDDPAFPGLSLVMWLGGSIAKYNLQDGHYEASLIAVPGQPNEIRTLAKGPDGNIYSGGYLGGASAYNPITASIHGFSGISQPEAITSAGDKLYFGVYPGARVVEFDTALPWGSGNPRTVLDLSAYDQDRPFGMLGVEEENKLFIGTVAAYGKHEGALAIYDLGSGQLDHMEKNIVHNQSVVSLAYLDGKVFGGTSIWGGLGESPTEQEGKLFVWDVATKTKITELTPVSGKRAVTGLIVGPDNNIWGIAEGVLFILDPKTYSVLYSSQLFSVHYGDTIWGDANMDVGTDGNVYGTSMGRFFKIDAGTKQYTLLTNTINDARYLAQDEFGHFYFRSSVSDLWKYTHEDLVLQLSDVILSAEHTTLQAGQRAQLTLDIRLDNGKSLTAYKDLQIELRSTNASVLSVEDGAAIALSPGQADLLAEVSLHDVTVQSLPLAFTVEAAENVDANGLQHLLDHYYNMGELQTPLYRQLSNRLTQAARHEKNGRLTQALDHLDKFFIQMHNQGMQSFITPAAKQAIEQKATLLREQWTDR